MLAFELAKWHVLAGSIAIVLIWVAVETLLEYLKHQRGEPSDFDEDAGDILDEAKQIGAVDYGKALIAAHASEEDEEDTPMEATPEEMLFISASTGYEDELQMLLDNGLDINMRDEDGHTPLMYTAFRGAPPCDSESCKALREKIDTLLDQRGDDNTDTWVERESTPVRMTRYLLDHGADTNARDIDGLTPLMHAAKCNVMEKHVPHPVSQIIAMLVEAGADVNAADNAGLTALHHAAIRGEEKSVEALLCAGADDKLRAKDGRDFADCLAEGGLTDILARVLEEQKPDLEAPDAQGRTRLMRLNCWFQAPVAELLLKHGANIDAEDKDGVVVYGHILQEVSGQLAVPFISRGKAVPDDKGRNEMFSMAGKLGDISAMQHLMDHFHPSPDSEEMLYALNKAAMEGQGEMVEFLLAAGVDPDSAPGRFGSSDDDVDDYKEGVHGKGILLRDVLGNAEHQDMRTIRALFKAGANVHRWDSDAGCNECLKAVAGAGTPEIMEMLIAAGVDPAKSNAGSVLEYAVMDAGNPVMVDYILDHWKVSPEGMTSALDYAVSYGHLDLVRHLIDRGAKVEQSTMSCAAISDTTVVLQWLLDNGYKGDLGKMLVDAAEEMKDGQVHILLAHGAPPDYKDEQGRTALMHAICSYDYPAFARENIVRDLLAAGADPNTRDNDGNDPVTSCLWWSGYWGRRIIPMLINAGAKVPATNAEGESTASLLRKVDLPGPIAAALEGKF